MTRPVSPRAKHGNPLVKLMNSELSRGADSDAWLLNWSQKPWSETVTINHFYLPINNVIKVSWSWPRLLKPASRREVSPCENMGVCYCFVMHQCTNKQESMYRQIIHGCVKRWWMYARGEVRDCWMICVGWSTLIDVDRPSGPSSSPQHSLNSICERVEIEIVALQATMPVSDLGSSSKQVFAEFL